MKKWLFAGVLIRIAVALITYHPDTRFFMFGNYLIVGKSLWLELYDFLITNGTEFTKVISPDAMTYPPLAFITNGLFASVLYRFVNMDTLRDVILNTDNYVGSPIFVWLLFLTKLPYLFADLTIGWVLMKLVNKDISLKVFKFWMLNPLTIYATFGIGMFGVYPILFTLLSVWFYRQKKYSLSGLMLGIGGAFKLFPMLFLPLVILDSGLSIKQRSMVFLYGIIGYLVPLIPYLPSKGFRTFALLAPQTDKMLFAKIPLTGAEFLSIFILGYGVLILLYMSKKLDLWKGMAAILFLFFSVTHFHPQWLNWISPWLILMYFEYPKLRWLLVAFLLIYLFLVFSFESSLNYGLVMFWYNAPALVTYIPDVIDRFKYLSILRSGFASIGFYMIYSLFSENKAKIVK